MITVFGLKIAQFSLVEGVLFGLTYGLLALGLVLVYKSNRVLNFAHAQIGVISAVVLQKLVRDHHLPYWPCLLLVLVLAIGLGAACELLLRRLYARPRLLVMVATIGLAQFLLFLSFINFIRPKVSVFPVPFQAHARVGSVNLLPYDMAILVFAPGIAIALAVFFRRSAYGLAIRAAAENAESARLGRIWVRRASTVAWMMAGLLSAITAILIAPTRGSTYGEALGPSLLVRALTAALIGGMIDLRTAFLAGIGVGIIEQVTRFNATSNGTVDLLMFGLLLVALLVRGRRLSTNSRTEERSSWALGAAARLRPLTRERARLGTAGSVLTLAVLLVLPLALPNSKAYLFARMFDYGLIALSLTMLSGWAGQVSLGQVGFVAVGAIVTARFGTHVPLLLLLPLAGLVTAAVAVLLGLPALRLRGLYLAVTTLGFAVLVRQWLLPDRTLGLPDQASQFVQRPHLFGLDLGPDRTWYEFSLVLLVVVVVVVANLRRGQFGRSLIAIRDNETSAGAMGIEVVRTKLTAFAVSGFLAGVAGVVFAYGAQRFNADRFDPSLSLVVIAMVVIGGIGSIRGALLGAAYLIGLPAIFGAGTTVTLLTSGVGLLVFILYVPGGLVSLLDRAGDALAGVLAGRRARDEIDRDLTELSVADAEAVS